MPFLVTVDPGESTGVALGSFGDDKPYTLIETWQPRGGAEGFRDFIEENGFNFGHADHVKVAELFVLRSAEKDGRVPNIEPKKIEGLMLAWHWDVIYQHRWMKANVKDQVLKDHGLWQTGKRFDHPDGRDANDAIVHALAYLKSKRHLPTLRKYWGPTGG